jgi:hypothetical protein
MTEKEAAEYLGISPRRLIYWRLRDVGPIYIHNFNYRSGRRLQISYDRKDLLAFKKKIKIIESKKKNLIPAEDAAIYININSATLSKWRKEKSNIPFIKIDNPCVIKSHEKTKFFYKKEDLDSFLSENPKKPECLSIMAMQKITGLNKDTLKKLRYLHHEPTFFKKENNIYYNKVSVEKYIETKNKERPPKTFKTGMQCIICKSYETYWEGDSKATTRYSTPTKQGMRAAAWIDVEIIYCSKCGMQWRNRY